MNNNDDTSSIERFKSYGRDLSNIVIESVREVMSERELDAHIQGLDAGLQRNIVSLYDAGVENRKIIELLNKYWHISMDDAAMWLRYEKVQYCYKVLKRHLISQGFSQVDVGVFMRKNKVSEKLETKPELLKLKDNGQKIKEALEKEE